MGSTNDAAPYADDGRQRKAGQQNAADGEVPLHRIRTVREEQGMSLRTVARHLQSDIPTLRKQENEFFDLPLSELRKWQSVLDVPIGDLLADPGTPLSRPVLERAHLLRVMKTAMAIRQQADSPALERLSRMLCEQLIELMPELSDVGAWHSVGQRRSLDEVGRILERVIRDDFERSQPSDSGNSPY